MIIDPSGWAERLGSFTRGRRWLAAFGFGGLSAAALPPVGLVLVLIPAFTGLLWLIGRTCWRGAAATGWWFGLGHFATGLYWVGSAFYVDAALYGWLAPFAILGLAAGMALFPAIALTIMHVFCRRLRLSDWAQALVLAVFWTLGEWLRGQVLTGFPWNLMGTVWVVSEAMLQTAAWIGVFGLGLLTVMAAALPAVLARGAGLRDWAVALSGVAVMALLWTGGLMRLAEAETGADDTTIEGVRLRLVQPNIAQHLKWKPDLRIKHVRRQLQMSRQAAEGAPPTHIIWAETAVPFNLSSDRPLQKILGKAVPADGLLITGAPRVEGRSGADQKLWNSAHALTPAGDIVATYDKRHLVPFGEYVPFRSILGFSKLTAGRLDFTPGTGPRTIDLPGLPLAAILICYEIIFPDEVPGDGERPGWLLNITNDAWFGLTAGPYQHLAAARMRAVEHGLPLVRVANTGISAVVDGYGRIIASLPLGQAGVLDTDLPKSLPATVFARYGGAMIWFLLTGVLLLCSVMGRRRND
jgi:apolipoprotein N-acyltransferase